MTEKNSMGKTPMDYKTEDILGVLHDLVVLEDDSCLDGAMTIEEVIERRNRLMRSFHASSGILR